MADAAETRATSPDAAGPVFPDGHLPAIDLVGQPDFVGAARLNPPPVFARFFKTKPISRRIGHRNGFDISSVLAHKVRARRPDRQENLDPRAVACRKYCL